MKQLTTIDVLESVNGMVKALEMANRDPYNYHESGMVWKGFSKKAFSIREVYDRLSIFDWWNETLSMTQLKQMKAFLEKTIALGFTGYVCFKVGAKGCSHGMWAYKQESTDGYSPDGDVIFHSFRSVDDYWSYCKDGKWAEPKLKYTDIKKAFA